MCHTRILFLKNMRIHSNVFGFSILVCWKFDCYNYAVSKGNERTTSSWQRDCSSYRLQFCNLSSYNENVH